MKKFILFLCVQSYLFQAQVNKSYESVSSIKICNNNQWLDFSNQSCKNCNPNCNNCYDDFCLECKIGTDTNLEKCLNSVQDCQEGYYFDIHIKQCQFCQIPFCKVCQNEDQCQQCKQDFDLDSGKCKWTKFSQDDPNYLKLIENKDSNNNVIQQTTSTCPPNYFENKQYRNCQVMNFQVSQSQADSNDQANAESVIQLIDYNAKIQIIILTKNDIKLFNRNDLSYVSSLIHFQQNGNDNDLENEQIQNGILFENILIIFTNKQIISFNLNNNSLESAYQFIQGTYKLNLKTRYFFDKQNNRIHYLYYDKEIKDLFIGFFSFTFNNKGQISEFSIKLDFFVLLPLNEQVYISATYIPERKYIINTKEENTVKILERQILISSQENVYIIDEQKFHDKYEKWLTTNITNEKPDVKKYTINVTLDNVPPSTLIDDCEVDNEDIYLLRHQVNFFYLIKLEISDKNIITSLPSKYLKFSSINMRAKLLKVNFDNNSSQIFLIVIQRLNTKNDTNYLNFKYIYSVEINLAYYCFQNKQNNSIYQKQVYYTKESLPLEDMQFYYFMNPQTKKQYLILNYAMFLKFFSLNQLEQLEKGIKDRQKELGSPKIVYQEINIKTSFSLILPLNGITNDCKFELIVPSNYATIQSICFQDSDDKVKYQVKYSQMNVFKNRQELFFTSPLIAGNNNLLEAKFIFDDQTQMLFVFQTSFSSQLFIYQIDIKKNQLVSSKIFQFEAIFSSQEFFIRGQTLILMLNNVGIYLIQTYSLQLIKFQPFQTIHLMSQPYYAIGTIKKVINEFGEFKVFNEIVQIQENDIIILENFLLDSIRKDESYERFDLHLEPQNKKCFALTYYVQENNSAITDFFCDNQFIQRFDQLDTYDNQNCQFRNGNELICVNGRYGDYMYNVLWCYWYRIELNQENKYIVTDSNLLMSDDVEDATNEFLGKDHKISFFFDQQNSIIILLSTAEDQTYFTVVDFNNEIKQRINFTLTNTEAERAIVILDEKKQLIFIIPKSKENQYANMICYIYVLDENQKLYVEQSKNIIQAQSKNSQQRTKSYAIYNFFGDNLQNFNTIILTESNYNIVTSSNINFQVSQSMTFGHRFLFVFHNQQFDSLTQIDGENIIFVQDIPKAKDLIQYISKYDPDILEPQWIYSQSLELIISIEKVDDPNISKKIIFLSIDNFEQLFKEITCELQCQIFWFEQYQILVILQSKEILSYKIQGGTLEQLEKYESIIPDTQFESSDFKCIQTQILPIIFCSKFGLYIIQEGFFLKDQSISIPSNFNTPIKENNQYVIFNNKIYDILEKEIKDFQSPDIKSISSITLSQNIQDQGFYFDNTNNIYDCFIFSLPGFNIMFRASTYYYNQNIQKISLFCLYNEQTDHVMIYYQQQWTFYKLPFPYFISSLQTEFQISIETKEAVYFQTNEKTMTTSNLIVGQYFQTGNVSFLIIDFKQKSKTIIQGSAASKLQTIEGFWPEKNALLTNEGILSLSNAGLFINIYGFIDSNKEYKGKYNRKFYSENYNYIITDSADFTGIFILSISQMFPINKKNSQLSSRFQSINTNIYDIFNNSDKDLANSLIYYDYEKNSIIEKKTIIQFSDQNNQKIMQQESTESNNLFDLYKIDFNKEFDNLKTYKLFILSQTDGQTQYIFQFKCSLILLDKSLSLKTDQMSLEQYNCNIFGGEDVNNGYSSMKHFSDQSIKSKQIKKYFLIQNQSILYEVSSLNQKFNLKKISSFDISSGYAVQDLMIWNNQKEKSPFYLFIIYQQQQKDKFQFIQIDEINAQKNKILDHTLPAGQIITSINMFEVNNVAFVIVGTNQSIRIYKVEVNQQILNLKFQDNKEAIFDIEQRGSINNILILKVNQDNIINLYTTSKSRIQLLQLTYDEQNKVINKLQLKEENLIHTRSHCHIKILMENKMLVVFDRLQASIYYNSLKLIGRIEEIQMQYIKNVQIADDKFTILVTDQENLLIYDLRKITNKNKFILQNQMYYINPTIYQIQLFKTKSGSGDLLIFFGYHLKGYMYIKYYSQPQDNIESSINSTNYNKNIISIILPKTQFQQEELFKQIIQDEKGFESTDNNQSEKVKYIYFILSKDSSDQEIFIPSNLLGISSEYSNNKLDIRIDLNNLKCKFRQHNIDKNVNFITSFYVQNGEIEIDQDINFLNLKNFIFSDIKLIFRNKQIQLQNLQSITFNKFNITGIKREIDQNYNNLKLNYNPLIFINNTIDINIIETTIIYVNYQRSFFLFQNCQNAQISNMKIYYSTFYGSIFIANQKTKNIKLNDIIIMNSSILQLIDVSEAQTLIIKRVKIAQSKQKTRILQSKENQQVNDLNVLYSFVKIQLVSRQTIIEDIILKNKKLQSFIDYTNSLYTNVDQVTGKQSTSLNSSLILKNIKITETIFQYFAIRITETKINAQNIYLFQCKNPSIFIQDTIKGLYISQIVFNKNIFINQQIIKVDNSILLFENMNFTENNLLNNKKSDISSIEIYNSDYSLGKIFAQYNDYSKKILAQYNDYSSNFILINNYLNKNQEYKADFLQINQLNSLSNLQILNNSMRAINVTNDQQQYDKFVNIYKSRFEQNNNQTKLEEGGAIYFLNVNAILVDVTIKNNSAKISGGGIYSDDSYLRMIRCNIQKNKALMGGGIRYCYTKETNLSDKSNQSKIPKFNQNDTQIVDNSASIFGKEYGSYPKKIKILNSTLNVHSSVNQNSFTLVFQLIGEHGEIVTFDDKSDIQIQNSKKINQYKEFHLEPIKYDNIQNVLIQEKKIDNSNVTNNFTLTAYIVNSNYSDLKTKLDESKKSELSKYLFYQNRKVLNLTFNMWDKQNSLNLNFNITFKKCTEGDFIQQIQTDYYECYRCQDNTYQIGNPYDQISQTQCQQCPSNTKKCEGQNIQPNKGYWNDPGTNFVGKCINEDQCPQISSTNNKDQILNGGCIEGGYGPLCESCDYDGVNSGGVQTYAKRNIYDCTKCGSVKDNLQQYVLPSLLILLFISYITYQIFSNAYHKINKLKAYILKQSQLIIVSCTLSEREKTSTTLKIMISYIQIVSIVKHFNLNFPDSLKQIAFFIGNVLDVSFYYLDCMFIDLKLNKKVKMIYLRLIWTIISPFLYCFLLILIGLFLQKKMHLVSRKRNLLISGFLQFYYMIYPGLINQTIGTICCKTINDKSYTLLDSQYECFDSDYLYFNVFLSAPVLFLTLLIPYFILKQIYKNKNKLMNVSSYLNFGFFYGEYRKEKYYWEIIRIYHKMFVYCIISIFNQQNDISGIIVSLSIIFYMKYLQISKPFQQNLFNQLELLSQLTAIITIFGAIINTKSPSQSLQYLALAIIVCVNIIFIFRCIICLSQFSFNKLNCPQISQMFINIRNKYPGVFGFSETKINNILRVTRNWILVKNAIKSLRINEVKPFSQRNIPQQSQTPGANNLFSSRNQLLFNSQNQSQEKSSPQKQQEILLSTPQQDNMPFKSDSNNMDKDMFSDPNQQNQIELIADTECNFEEQIDQIILYQTKEIQQVNKKKQIL